jgi:hypothetical protein
MTATAAPAETRAAAHRVAVPRPRWWPELLVIVWLCWVYDAIANLAPLRRQAAYEHARSLLHIERVLHVDPEAALNHWLAGHHTLAVWISNYYDNAHFVVTLGVVGWLWWRHPDQYRPLRSSLILINVIGLMVFWRDPTAPPRLLDPGRYVDVVAATHAFGSWHSGTLATAANQLAAMPSLHMAWAAWSSLAVWQVFRGRRAVLLVWAYPLVTAIAVMATGNHFLLDIVAGVATVTLATLIADRWRPWWTAATFAWHVRTSDRGRRAPDGCQSSHRCDRGAPLDPHPTTATPCPPPAGAPATVGRA